MTMHATALILGATGGIGGEMARQLSAAGYKIRALSRRPPSDGDSSIEWIGGDALNAADVARAARGCALIVHAVNPPKYQRWAQWVLPMLDNTIAAAAQSGATIVFPGTVYNFGPDAFPLVHERAPQNPLTRKGAIRVEMERRLREASLHGVRVIVVRAGDYFGPQAGNNWFSQSLVRPGKPVTSIVTPAGRNVGHQWAYLPDVARTMVMLIERRATLAAFADYHMAGHWDDSGQQISEAIALGVEQRSGQRPVVRRFPWVVVRLLSPLVPLFKELSEMRYLWRDTVRLDNRKLLEVLGSEPHTPLPEAVMRTLEGLGCLPAQPRTA
jgi:nucleoside-diphosphate-sugar epimerase